MGELPPTLKGAAAAAVQAGQSLPQMPTADLKPEREPSARMTAKDLEELGRPRSLQNIKLPSAKTAPAVEEGLGRWAAQFLKLEESAACVPAPEEMVPPTDIWVLPGAVAGVV